jgi:membrane protease YdiL (CAAX protease family)
MSGVRRLVLSGVALTALLALVAVASRAHKPGGSSGASTGHVPRTLVEYAASVLIVLLFVGMIVIVLAMANTRRQAVLSGDTNWQKWRRVIVLAIIALIGVVAVRHFHVSLRRPPSSQATLPGTLPQTGTTSSTGHARPSPQPEFQWLAVVILAGLVLGVGATIAFAVYLRRKHGDEWDEEAALLAALDEVLADTLDDLRAERDPRRAVIRTYARMERTFAAYGVPRQESEAPLEYVARVLDRLSISVYSVRKVTQLFARAKFSAHRIDTGMKDEAIDALAGLKAELEHKEGEEAA